MGGAAIEEGTMYRAPTQAHIKKRRESAVRIRSGQAFRCDRDERRGTLRRTKAPASEAAATTARKIKKARANLGLEKRKTRFWGHPANDRRKRKAAAGSPSRT